MKKVYVASPVRAVLKSDKYRKNIDAGIILVEHFAKMGCYAVKRHGHIPISPVLAFNGIYDEFEEREEIEKACEALLLTCDCIYVIDTPYNHGSKGIAMELEIAAKNGIEILGASNEPRIHQ